MEKYLKTEKRYVAFVCLCILISKVLLVIILKLMEEQVNSAFLFEKGSWKKGEWIFIGKKYFICAYNDILNILLLCLF